MHAVIEQSIIYSFDEYGWAVENFDVDNSDDLDCVKEALLVEYYEDMNG